MALSEERKEDLRLEEAFRHEVRQALASQKPPPTVWDRLAAFGESKVGFWVVTSVLAGALVGGFELLQRLVDRDRIARTEAVQRTHRDVEMVMKLHPMLTSDKQAVVAAGVQVLQEMARSEAVDGKLVKIMVDSLLESTLAAARSPAATPENRMQAETVLAGVADVRRLAEIQAPPAAADAPPAPATASAVRLDARSLPPRLYIQVGSEEDREQAALMRPALHSSGFLVPGVEKVQSTPRLPEIRYCEGKVGEAHPGNLKKVIDPFFTAQVKLVVLAPSLCTKVRENHFELWFPRRA